MAEKTPIAPTGTNQTSSVKSSYWVDMGQDVIQYKGNHELFNDFELLIVRHFFIEESGTLERAKPSPADYHSGRPCLDLPRID
jgi:hypothetical protein